jgi:hypothetical protein
MLNIQKKLSEPISAKGKACVSKMKASKTLTHRDIQEFLVGVAGAIELDQIRVDALPTENFHPLYNDGMWRMYRSDHLVIINQLLKTSNEVPPEMLEALTRLAITYETAVVRKALLHLFSGTACGDYAEECESAALFFGWLMEDVSCSAPARSIVGEPRELMMQWLTVTDPLHIAEDPECGYGRPEGFVN